MAGEASGDLHGANLVRAIRDLAPHTRFFGIGGKRMEDAGVTILFPSSDLAVVGFTEVFSRLRVIRKAYLKLKSILRSENPDLLIVIDYPDFNLLLAGAAKKFHVPVLYYISPQVWAWRPGRVKKIADRADRVAVILPFEQQFYRRRGVAVEYVGHPLMDIVPDRLCKEEILGSLGLSGKGPIIGLLPGSRREEVIRLLPVMISAVEALSDNHPGLACLLPLAPTITPDLVHPVISGFSLPIRIQDDMYSVLAASDLVLVASGTATLEAAIMQVPMVVVYRVSPLTFWLGKLVVKVPFISLVNLIAGERIVPELIQGEVTPSRVAEEAETILESGPGRESMVNRLGKLKESLGGRSASEKTARIAVEMMRAKSVSRPLR
ncbi:MAG: lipid-A-disaccharide synthase [Desulfobacterales bacterium]|nr:lipid-A-disaccharide synthase [Desulfobacterales bacterium]